VLFTNDQYVYMFYSESTKCKKNPTSRKPARWSPGGDIRMVKSRDGFTWTAPVTIYTQVRALAPPMKVFLAFLVRRVGGAGGVETRELRQAAHSLSLVRQQVFVFDSWKG
jgi:hypothetical protein